MILEVCRNNKYTVLSAFNSGKNIANINLFVEKFYLKKLFHIFFPNQNQP